ncbi:MAG: hypothetical protein JW864_13875 [Spirochaetes bacterium]|nr:hypothetical protein [Spirochaetota bacterium]
MKKISAILIICVLSIFPAACNSLNDSNTATVTIDTGIRTSKAAAPSDVTDIAVTVSGEGMATMTRSIPADTGMRTFEVPVGTARLFAVTASGQTFKYLGSATYDIVENEEVNINITMVRQAGILNLPYQSSYSGTTESFTVTVSIPETGGSVEYTFPPDDTTTKYVPSGNNRQIAITATPLAESAVISFSTVTTTADFVTGQYTDVFLLPIVAETKLVIPDIDDWNGSYYRLIILENFIAPTWNEILGANLTNTISSNYNFYPWDIDFDKQGRIYVAVNSSEEQVLRIDSLSSLNDTEIVPYLSGSGVEAIAIDRNNNYLYHTRGTDLRRTDIASPGTGTALDLSAFTNPYFTAIAVDDQGMLYLSDSAETTPSAELVQDRIVKYNPETGAIITTYSSNIDFLLTVFDGGATKNISDIMIRDNYVYVANYGGVDGSKIFQLNTDLQYVDSYGNTSETNTSRGYFYGPHHFVGIRNDQFVIIDENFGNSFNPLDKLISMEDMNGTNWSVFDPSSYEESFSFYYYC